MKPLLIAALAILSAVPAQAQTACGPRDGLMKMLAGKYQEQRRGMGLLADGAGMVEVFRSASGSWTIVISHVRGPAAGTACIAAAGEDWHDVPPEARPEGTAL